MATDTRADTSHDSVDLLRMTTSCHDASSASATSSPARSLSLDSNARRARLVSIPEAHHATCERHVCAGCPHCSVYYDRKNTSSTDLNWTPGNDEGSIYFNYIQFAKKGNQQKTKTYEPVYRSAQQSASPSHPLLGCFRHPSSSTSPLRSKTSTTYKFSPPLNNEDCDNFAAEHHHNDRQLHAIKPRRTRTTTVWNSRFRRLLILAAIGSGLVLALGGLILGFVVLGPLEYNSGPRCITGYVPCGEKGCVNVQHLCRQVTNDCPKVDRNVLCSSNGTLWLGPPHVPATTDPATVKYTVNVDRPVTLGPTTIRSTTPTYQGDPRWAHFAGGSHNGSKYTIVNSAMTFYGAQEECRKLGGYLVHVNSIREQMFIMDFLQIKLLNPDISQDGVGFWLGARRARGSHSGTCMYDQWKWIDPYNRQHGVISGFTAFVPGKPDNYFSPEECLFITYNYRSDEAGYLHWDDAPCDIHSVGGVKVLCEVEMNIT
ncbi:hypothetical protein CAPTEDRAFT_223072 [Capitella teleta]|uniref:C-type lectin domain-containing protein n=1 Tax=Capitella teleta TaxID=283909 RepID=R7TZ53_CAPTE|nr:hypothetical protein CAPTEDRAFT_223072 [Capitella teleta]|eukprot:ELT98897.1 hypothetical protein CAPTEDRAFT_223072 [Capitella teleta]